MTTHYSGSNSRRIVGFVGFKGSGKDTASMPLIERGYVPISFGDALKDVLAAIFCWPRDMLEGVTAESRAWRETVDPWWAKKLGIPKFTPRYAMQTIGTDVMREHFNASLWVMNVERKMLDLPPTASIVIRDCRFEDEIGLIRRHGGRIIRIQRGPEPEWIDVARLALRGCVDARSEMKRNYQVHLSEYAWMASRFDEVIPNDNTVEALRRNIVHFVA